VRGRVREKQRSLAVAGGAIWCLGTGEHDVGGFLNPLFNGNPGARGRGAPEETLFLPARYLGQRQLEKNQFRRNTLMAVEAR